MSQGQGDGGLTNACDRLKQASALSGDLNSKTAALCTNNQYACVNACSALIAKYQNIAANCGDDCENYSTLQDAISSLQSTQTTCSSLAPNSNALSVASLSSGGDEGLSSACQSQGGTSPSSPGDSGTGSSAPLSTASLQSNGLPADATSSYEASAGPTARLSEYQAASSGSGEIGGGASDGRSSISSGSGYGQTPAQVRPVPGDMNGFGISGAVASLTDALGNSPGSPGFPTEIDQGLRSGGYSVPGGPGPTNGDALNKAAELFRGGRKLASDVFGGLMGLDLKQFLPGGSRYRVAGQRNEINAKEEDLFHRVSLKYAEKCQLGELYRCRD